MPDHEVKSPECRLASRPGRLQINPSFKVAWPYHPAPRIIHQADKNYASNLTSKLQVEDGSVEYLVDILDLVNKSPKHQRNSVGTTLEVAAVRRSVVLERRDPCCPDLKVLLSFLLYSKTLS